MGARRFLGREVEQRRIRALVGGARNGRGGALCITGEPGIGKTALLDETTTGLSGLRVLRVDGFEAESTIPYAALQRLARPLRPFLDRLPDTHHKALSIAAGAAEGAPPDRFLVGLGVLGLLAAAAEDSPTLCVLDDTHLLDQESLDILAFVARRLEAESLAVLLASREIPHLDTQLAGIPLVRLAGLEHDLAVRLLMTSLPEAIDPASATQIVAATGGNPLALVDLAAELSARRLTESSLADEPIPIGHHLEALYLRRIRHLSTDLQTWLLVAAADSTGNIDLIQLAAAQLGLPEDPGDRAESAGLVDLTHGITFRHPLVRSAAYNAAMGPQRRAAHRALSAAADQLGLVQLEAWHAAKATLGTDPDVADRLERVADLAGRRGGLSTRAKVLAQASTLTPPGPQKYARLVSAAEAALGSGSAHLAKTLLDDVDEDVLDPVARGRLVSTRASIAIFIADPALRQAGATMLSAAEAFHGHDPVREQNALIKAFEYTLPAERLARGASLAELGARLRKGADQHPGTAATILSALGAHILLPYDQAVPVMREAVDAIADLDAPGLLQYGSVSVALTTALWDNRTRRVLLERTARAARDAGSLQLLDTVLWTMSLAELSGGTPRLAHHYIEQVRELRRAIGYDAEHVINVALLAWSGAPRAQVEQISLGAAGMGFGGVQSAGETALAVRDLAEGGYADALARLRPFVDDPFLQVTPLQLADFVEAAVRSGHPDQAPAHVDRLERLAEANGSPWALGVAQRSRALTVQDPEDRYLAAIATLQQADAPIDLGRAHLLYGEWLRRGRRRAQARTQLHHAHRLFDRERAPAFAARAARELDAMGDHPAVTGAAAESALTAQELTVARLAATGSTNAEIGATMFLSPNTVDYHLRKVFQKLEISSRRQLAEHLDTPP